MLGVYDDFPQDHLHCAPIAEERIPPKTEDKMLFAQQYGPCVGLQTKVPTGTPAIAEPRGGAGRVRLPGEVQLVTRPRAF